jgi:hypothetical protein
MRYHTGCKETTERKQTGCRPFLFHNNTPLKTSTLRCGGRRVLSSKKESLIGETGFRIRCRGPCFGNGNKWGREQRGGNDVNETKGRTGVRRRSLRGSCVVCEKMLLSVFPTGIVSDPRAGIVTGRWKVCGDSVNAVSKESFLEKTKAFHNYFMKCLSAFHGLPSDLRYHVLVRKNRHAFPHK